MALAIRFDYLIKTGQVRDQAELARVGHVSRARLTQIMNLLFLAPDIQEMIFQLPPILNGKDAMNERDLRLIAVVFAWRNQRNMWNQYLRVSFAVRN